MAVKWEIVDEPDDPETAAMYERIFDAMEAIGRLADRWQVYIGTGGPATEEAQ